jgi:hypothetical protein
LLFMASLANIPNAVLGLSIPELVGYPWRDFLDARHNPPEGTSFRPLSRSCTLHYRSLHFACPAMARSDFRRLALTRNGPSLA